LSVVGAAYARCITDILTFLLILGYAIYKKWPDTMWKGWMVSLNSFKEIGNYILFSL